MNIIKNEKKEEVDVEQAFNAASGWVPHTKQFTINWKEKEVKALPGPTHTVVELKCYLQPFDGVCEICDVELVASK